MTTKKVYFWEQKTLDQLSHDEWESLCDGCAKCCLQQLEDEDSGTLVFTDVACDLLDGATCRCSDYSNRSERVPSCMTLTPSNVTECAEFAPPSCAYRLLVEGKPLPEWHHLLSGSPETIHTRNLSVRDKTRSASSVQEEDLEDYVVDWPEFTG